MGNLSALNGNGAYVASVADMASSWTPNGTGANVLKPEVFYDTQLLDTIRDAAESYQYFKYAKPVAIGNNAHKLTVRRWAPLQAHTTPLEEGIAPMSDKGSVEVYEISAGNQYGRYMEFSDKVDFEVVDPVISIYTSEYSIVAVETLDLLARDTLLTVAQKYFVGGAANYAALTAVSSKVPALADFRLIGLALKKAKVKPYDTTYHVLVSPEFVYDMLDDPYVQNYMRINQTTGNLYDGASDVVLVDMFGFSFHEVVNCPTSTAWYASGKWHCIMTDGTDFYQVDQKDGTAGVSSGYVKDKRTGKDASYIPNQIVWGSDTAACIFKITAGVVASTAETSAPSDLVAWKVNHILILGADALCRTAISGQDQAKMYVKPLGSAGVVDPIDQRQSIGFKINDIGFGCTRLEAVIDYICVPTQTNI